MCEQFFCGGLDEADALVARHSREPGQKIVDGLPPFQVIHKVLHGCTRVPVVTGVPPMTCGSE